MLTNKMFCIIVSGIFFCVLCSQHPHVDVFLVAVNLLAPAMFAFNLIPEDGPNTVVQQWIILCFAGNDNKS